MLGLWLQYFESKTWSNPAASKVMALFWAETQIKAGDQHYNSGVSIFLLVRPLLYSAGHRMGTR